MSIFSTRLVPAVAAAAVLAGLAASPASAARAHRYQGPVAMQDSMFMPTAPMPPELYGSPDSNCYPTRIQVPTVGGGLQWQNQMTCPYADN